MYANMYVFACTCICVCMCVWYMYAHTHMLQIPWMDICRNIRNRKRIPGLESLLRPIPCSQSRFNWKGQRKGQKGHLPAPGPPSTCSWEGVFAFLPFFLPWPLCHITMSFPFFSPSVFQSFSLIHLTHLSFWFQI